MASDLGNAVPGCWQREGGRKLKGHKGKKTSGEGETVTDEIMIPAGSYLIKPAADMNILCFQSKCNSSLHVNDNHKSIMKTRATGNIIIVLIIARLWY